MTKPKMMTCPGSGRKVFGEDEPDGTVQCMHPKCGTSGLVMKKTVTADGKVEFSVPKHECRVNPIRIKRKGRRPVPPRDRGGRRDSGRRR